MKLSFKSLLLLLALPLAPVLSGAYAGHHEKEEASDPITAAAEFPLLLRPHYADRARYRSLAETLS